MVHLNPARAGARIGRRNATLGWVAPAVGEYSALIERQQACHDPRRENLKDSGGFADLGRIDRGAAWTRDGTTVTKTARVGHVGRARRGDLSGEARRRGSALSCR